MSNSAVLHDLSYIGVNVHAGDTAFGCKVHVHTPVQALVPQLREEFITRCGGSGELYSYLSEEKVAWALEAGPLRKRIDPDTTLSEAGVNPGTDLYLTKRTATENFPILRDDVAEGAAAVSKRVFTTVDERDTRRLGAAALPFAAGAASAIGLAAVLGGASPLRWVVVAVLGALAVMSASVAVVLTRTYDEYRDVAAALSVSAYIAAAAAAFAAVPRSPGVWHLTVAGAAVATVVVLLASLTGNRPAALHAGFGTASIAAVLTGLIVLALKNWLPMNPQAVAALLVFVSAAVAVWGTQISRRIGGVLVSYLPTTGEPLVIKEDRTVHAVSKRSTSADAIEAMLNQENRVITALRVLTGVVTAAGLLLVFSAGAAGYFTRNYEWHTFALVACAAVAVVSVGRGLVIRAASIPLVVAGPLAATAYLAGRALSPTAADAALLAAGSVPLLLVVLLSAIWAVRSRTMHSPLDKRRLEVIAAFAVAAMFPLLVLIMEGWSKVRGR